MSETKKKIMIIEDNKDLQDIYRHSFEKHGYEVVVEGNGLEGINSVVKSLPDVILLDLMMPEMTGDEMLAELRKKAWGKDIIVIILTNLGEEEAPKTLRALGIHSYIVKAELTPSQVVARVQAALEPTA